VSWRGDPDDGAAETWLLAWLRDELHLTFRPPGSPAISTRIQGNLGESVTFKIGRSHDFAGCRAFAVNALDPLQDISRSGLDMSWVHFADDNPADDIAVIQEVKTTVQNNLSLADGLLSDIEKLFGTNPAFTLPGRLTHVANVLEFEQGNKALAERVLSMLAHTPQSAKRVQVVATLVHDAEVSGSDVKLTAVLVAATGFGWSKDQLTAWSIALSDLGPRLQRLSEGGSH
jgi:hypothetical protein